MTRLFSCLFCLLLGMTSASAALPETDSAGHPLPSLAPLVERVSTAVVNIVTFGGSKSPATSNRPSSTGSGVIIDAAEGLILSNHHVVGDAERIRITLVDERQFDAELVGSDPAVDLALLRIDADKLQALPLADSDRLRVGDFVIAVGNPFGLGQTVTSGIVSALGRTGLGIENYEDFIQTDASINPGNSGGALINLQGQLVGINTAILAPNGGNSGIGFAIPANMAKAISDHLAAKGDASRGTLGVSVQDMTPSLARAFGLPAEANGVLVSQVKPGSAAARAGVQVADIIVAINGQSIRNAADLKAQLGVLTLEETLQLTLLRQQQRLTVSATLDQPKRLTVEGVQLNPLFAGVVFNGDQELPGIPVLSVRGDSNAAAKGLSPGDLIVSVNQQRVRSVDELATAVKEQRGLLLVVNRRGGPYFVALD
ncbi:Do family serine endopeptidase [Motiliproteus sediminis]|uniref:Do family serine endopeptidase n=1 Tax=Motiliproteus sediminis TaxID=1468178 RepID=UPI001FEB71B9|nr:Do family serine endopeptidase [Motiliproteus sediminis]